MIGITCWVGVFIVVTGVLIILVLREERRRPLNLADRTKHSQSLGLLLLTGDSAHDPDWLVSDSGRMTGNPEVILKSWQTRLPDKS